MSAWSNAPGSWKPKSANGFAVAEATDAEEDKRYGADKAGEEMPDCVTDKQRRAERIRQAKAELETEANASAEAKLKAAAGS
jgi:hypothetical protein